MKDVSDYVTAQKQLLQAERDHERNELSKSMHGTKLNSLEASGLAITGLHVQSISSDMGGRQLILLSTHAKRQISSPRISTGDIVTLRLRSTRNPSHSTASCAASSSECKQQEQEKKQTDGVVTKLADSTIEIACDSQLVDDQESITVSTSIQYVVIKSTSDVTHNRYISSLSSLTSISSDPTHPSHRIINLLLLRDTTPKFMPQLPRLPNQSVTDSSQYDEQEQDQQELYFKSLNEGQLNAVHQSLRAHDLSVIIGPPGTGKTTTISAYIAYESLKLRHKLLVVAPSNTAVDNIATRLHDLNVKFIRAGHSARMTSLSQLHSLDYLVSKSEQMQLANDIRIELNTTRNFTARKALRKELRRRERSAVTRVLDGCGVLLATVSGAGARVLDDYVKGGAFDIVVVDEAAQALEAAVWPAITRGKKVVLAGDPYQLGGTVKSDIGMKGGLQKSILDRVIEDDVLKKDCVVMLTRQYRMHEVICEWSSQEFYGGELYADASAAKRDVTSLPGWNGTKKHFEEEKNGEGGEEGKGKGKEKGEEKGEGEEEEEEEEEMYCPFIVIDTVGGDCEEENAGGSSGDVTENSSKRNYGEAGIIRRVVKEFVENGVNVKDIGVLSPYSGQVELMKRELRNIYGNVIEVATIDSFQGREKEVMCISMVRSNESGQVGFLKDDRRLNVAITRAKRCVVVVCDSETVCKHDLIDRMVKYAEEFGMYRSAVVEFQDIVGTFSQLRRPKEAIEAAKVVNKVPNKDRSNEKVRGMRSVGGISTSGNFLRQGKNSSNMGIGRRTTGGSTDTMGSSRKTGESNEGDTERVEQLKKEIREEIERFMENELVVEKWFAKRLSALERRIVHEVAEDMAICHASHGEGNDRQVNIWKRRGNIGGESSLADSINAATISVDNDILEEFGGLELDLDDLDDTMKDMRHEEGDCKVNGDYDGDDDRGDGAYQEVQTESNEEYGKNNQLLGELWRAREEQRKMDSGTGEGDNGGISILSGTNSQDQKKEKKKRGKKKSGNKKKSSVTEPDDEDEEFEKTLQKYGYNGDTSTGTGASGSVGSGRFSPSVAQIVNGVLTRPVGGGSTSSKGHATNAKKLADRLAKETAKRKRKSKT